MIVSMLQLVNGTMILVYLPKMRKKAKTNAPTKQLLNYTVLTAPPLSLQTINGMIDLPLDVESETRLATFEKLIIISFN